MSALTAQMESRAAVAVPLLGARPALAAEIEREVGGFFSRHPGLDRTRLADAFITSLILEKLSTAADSQSAAPTAETKKVA